MPSNAQPPEPAPVGQRVSVRPKTDLEVTEWGTAKRLVAFLLQRSPREINSREAWKSLRRSAARRTYRENHDQITWGEAKEVIADLLDVTKAIIDAEERRLEIEELTALSALEIKGRKKA